MNMKKALAGFCGFLILSYAAQLGFAAQESQPEPAQECKVQDQMKMKLDMIGIFVSDMGTMARFYHEVLGYKIKTGGSEKDSYTEFEGAGIRLSMYKRELLPSMLGQTPSYPKGINGTFELVINVGAKENVDKVYQELLSKGATSVYAPRDEPWKMRASMIADPEGNLIEIGSDFWN